MCEYCETNKCLVVFSTKPMRDNVIGVGLGNSWGWRDRHSRLMRDKKGAIRLMTGGNQSAPIEFCPKCGRKLLTSHKPNDTMEV